MRALIFELRRDPVHDGLVAALARHARGLGDADTPTIEVRGPTPRLELSREVEAQLYGIGREALANVVKHAGATTALVRVEGEQVLMEIRDNGRGFDPSAGHPGHFGLESMRSRAAEIGGRLTIASGRGRHRRPCPRPVPAMTPELEPEPDESIGVLVVDDHEVVRRGLLAFLDSEPDIEVLGQAAGASRRSSCSRRWTRRTGCRT